MVIFYLAIRTKKPTRTKRVTPECPEAATPRRSERTESALRIFIFEEVI